MQMHAVGLPAGRGRLIKNWNIRLHYVHYHKLYFPLNKFIDIKFKQFNAHANMENPFEWHYI